jgi:hypothetical protein
MPMLNSIVLKGAAVGERGGGGSDGGVRTPRQRISAHAPVLLASFVCSSFVLMGERGLRTSLDLICVL